MSVWNSFHTAQESKPDGISSASPHCVFPAHALESVSSLCEVHHLLPSCFRNVSTSTVPNKQDCCVKTPLLSPSDSSDVNAFVQLAPSAHVGGLVGALVGAGVAASPLTRPITSNRATLETNISADEISDVTRQKPLHEFNSSKPRSRDLARRCWFFRTWTSMDSIRQVSTKAEQPN